MVVAKPIAMEAERWKAIPQPRRSPRPRPGSVGKLVPFWTLCLFVLLVNAVLYGFLTASALRVNELTRELVRAEETGRRLELEIARLSSYPRLVRDSERRLALRPAATGLLAVGYVSPETPVLRTPPPLEAQGLLATIHDYFRAFGQAAASIR
ncbi:MAG: hypothetical protein ACUVRM_07775 [Bacillota bacterium]